MDASGYGQPGLPWIHAVGGGSRPPTHGEGLFVSPRTATLPGPIRGVLFDMGNVLYDDTLWRRWVLRLLGHIGLHTNYRSFFRIWDRDYLDDVHRGRREFFEAFQAFLLSAGLSHSQIDELEAACRARHHQLEVDARPLPGVKTTLERLHQSGTSGQRPSATTRSVRRGETGDRGRLFDRPEADDAGPGLLPDRGQGPESACRTSGVCGP
jgi:hypothetical protein